MIFIDDMIICWLLTKQLQRRKSVLPQIRHCINAEWTVNKKRLVM